MKSNNVQIKKILLVFFMFIILTGASCTPAVTPAAPTAVPATAVLPTAVPPTEPPPTLAPTEAPAATPTVYGGAEQPVAGNWWEEYPLPSWSKLKQVTLSPETSWFQVYEVVPNVYAIFEPGNWQQVMSYLIIGTEKAMLLDTGMNIGNIKQVVDELTKLPVFVLNTHAHPDHVAGNYMFQEIWGVDNDWAKQQAKGISADALTDFSMKESFVNSTYPPGFDPSTYVIKPYTVTHFVKEGDKIDMGNRVLEVIFTPGHSPDGIALIDRQNRLLWVEDVYYTGPLYAYLTESNFDDYLKTAEKLAALSNEVDYLLSSHSETPVSSEWLVKMYEAFKAIQAGTAKDFTDEGGIRTYPFDGFSILLPTP